LIKLQDFGATSRAATIHSGVGAHLPGGAIKETYIHDDLCKITEWCKYIMSTSRRERERKDRDFQRPGK
jgi:hypothetical protein